MMARRANIEEIKQARRDYVRLCLAREMYDNELVDACQAHPLFRVQRGKKRHVLSRSSIRKHYVYKVREYLRTVEYDARFETMRAYERLMCAYRQAVENEDPKAMVMVQRAVNKMLGLRRDPGQQEPINAEQLRGQLQAIHDSIGGT